MFDCLCMVIFSIQRPSQLEGYTRPIANDRGHLLGGVPRSENCPWGGFAGTWDTNKGMKTKPFPFGSMSHNGAAEILTIHPPTAGSVSKEITEKPPASPVPEPVDEKDIGISKHIKAVKKVELNVKEGQGTEKDVCVTPPVPRTAERKEALVL